MCNNYRQIIILRISGFTHNFSFIYRYTSFNANLHRSQEWSKSKQKTRKPAFPWKSSMLERICSIISNERYFAYKTATCDNNHEMKFNDIATL